MKFTSRLALVLALFINCLLFISCSKEEEPFSPPVIEIYQPGENSVYKAGDTIHLLVAIAEDEFIDLITVTLKNNGGSPIKRHPDVRPASSKYLVKTEIIIPSEVEDGRHYVEITASNGKQQSSRFRYIQVGNTALLVDRIFLFSESVNYTNIYTLEDTILKEFASKPGDFMASAINLQNNQLISIGRFDGDLTAHDVESGQLVWKYASSSLPGNPTFNAFFQYADVSLFSHEEQKLQGILPSGALHVDVQLPSGFESGAIFVQEGKLIYERIDKSTNEVRLIVRNFPTGLADEELSFGYGRIAHIFTNGQNEVIIFSNGQSKQYILRYDFILNELTELEYGTTGSYGAMCQVDNNTLIFEQGGSLYRYNIKQRVTTTLKSGYAPTVMRYNKATGSLWCALGNNLTLFDPHTGVVVSEIKLSRQIDGLEFLYNR